MFVHDVIFQGCQKAFLWCKGLKASLAHIREVAKVGTYLVSLFMSYHYFTVLGHRPQTSESRRTLSLGDKQRHRITTCSRIETKRLETLFKHFEEVCK